MKLLIVLLSIFVLVSCGSEEGEKEEKSSIDSDTMEKLETVQEDNISLEQMDGQLDSLINEIQ